MPFYDLKTLRNINLVYVLVTLYNAIEIIAKKSINTVHYLLGSNQKIAVTGSKWIDNTTGYGGIGAIDLVVYLDSISMMEAAQKLYNINTSNVIKNNIKDNNSNNKNFIMPKACNETWNFVKYYLEKIRFIPSYYIDYLHQKSLLWSDERNNCVFPRDLNSGVFLRGTVPGKPFKLTLGNNGRPYIIPGDNLVIITEAPIDAISLRYYNQTATILATGGRTGFNKIEPYLCKASKVLLAQDNDKAGDEQALLISKNLNILSGRLRPLYNLKDWNDVLKYDIQNNIYRETLF